MATNQMRSPLQRPKTHWFLSCLGISLCKKNTTSSASKSKKNNKSNTNNNNNNNDGRRRRSFRLCMPKIRIIIIRKKKKHTFDSNSKAATYTQSMIKGTLLNDATYASFAKPKLNVQPKGSSNDDSSLKSKLSTTLGRLQEAAPTDKTGDHMKVAKDSLKGVSIMVIMLIIMSIWGRLCAILCMSAWLYCVPLLRACRDATPDVDNIKLDMASKLYRKRVTLEGLFQTDT